MKLLVPLLLIVLLGVMGYWTYNFSHSKESAPSQVVNTYASQYESKTYTNSKYGFAFEYSLIPSVHEFNAFDAGPNYAAAWVWGRPNSGGVSGKVLIFKTRNLEEARSFLGTQLGSVHEIKENINGLEFTVLQYPGMAEGSLGEARIVQLKSGYILAAMDYSTNDTAFIQSIRNI
jgi:hypothetical protein